jgi:cobalt-zinc-cadmium efflux system outer membrane protein
MGLAADSTAIVLVDSLRIGAADTRALLEATDSAVVLTAPPSTTVSPITLPSSTPTTAPTRSGSTMGSTSGAPASTAPGGATTGSAASASALGPTGATAGIAAAEASLQSAEAAIVRERRGIFGVTSFQVGVEWGDPTTDPPDNEKLYLFGINIPIPLFNQNQGGIAQATAERDRARAELARVRLETRQRIVEGYRELASLRVRVARDQDLVVRAQRVAAKSLTAYREGASALPAVLEARRAAREVLGQYIDDLTALLTLQSELRVLGLPVQPQ